MKKNARKAMSERRGTKALELWCRRITEGYPDVKIENMTSSWRDGLAFCAMIHHFRPDLIDFGKLNKTDVYYNNTLAFTTAEKYLGIPALLDADDMATYEVPDRLSVLTYLSQFYQVFAAQEAHSRLKRSSSSASDKTQTTKSSGPPPKMAHVVGVPKRDPCQKCQLPVFLAERLMVGIKVYHRTCLKCARCGYQLTPGSFYETETDEQYCCETCPDEENIEQLHLDNEATTSDCSSFDLKNTVESESNVLPCSEKSFRSSIKERLAFFESQREDAESDRKLLKQSLSDEEKSKSLHRFENSLEMVENSYRPNEALSNFLINAVDDSEHNSEQNSKTSEISDSEDDTNNLTNVSLPPELPKSLPPLAELNLERKHDEEKRFTVSAQLVFGSPSKVASFEKPDEQQNIISESAAKIQNCEMQTSTSSSTIDNTYSNNNNNKSINGEENVSASTHGIDYIADEKTVQLRSNILEDSLELYEPNDNNCVTKDKLADEIDTYTKAEDLHHIIHRKDIAYGYTKPMTKPDEIKTIRDGESVKGDIVKLRTKSNKEILNISLPTEDSKTIKRLSVIDARLQQFELVTNNERGEALSCKQSQEKVNSDVEIDDSTKNPVSNVEIKRETETQTLKATLIDEQVPLTINTKDSGSILECNLGYGEQQFENNNSKEKFKNIQITQRNTSQTSVEEYPDDLNPFKSDEENEELIENNKENIDLGASYAMSPKNDNLNPFDSSDDEVELEKTPKSTSNNLTPKVPPPRPPPPRISKNPFESEDEEETSTKRLTRRPSLTGSQNRKTPVPTPRSNIEFYGSANSLHSNNGTPTILMRNSDVRSSNNSLNLSSGGTIRSRKSRRAPLPPAPVKELFPSNETINSSSKTSTPSSSTVGTPKSARKKRLAPAPPKPARLESLPAPQIQIDIVSKESKNLSNYPLQSELDSKLSDEEKALLEGKTVQSLHSIEPDLSLSPLSKRSSKRLIPLDQELLEEHGSLLYVDESNSQCDDLKRQNQQISAGSQEEEPNVVYRRVLIPQNLETPTHEHNALIEDLCKSSSVGERQLEKLKDNKEANNRNRQSQISVTSSGADDNEHLFNKSAHGKWKRRKGPAPALPIPPRKVLQMLPLQEIKHELEIIEVQQLGLEKQGVILEKMIRDRCEGENGERLNTSGLPVESGDSASNSSAAENSKEVENLILQLFELVNEKNELFRRQAELMYLRRQHRLEQEQADLEYEIRTLMAQPERNKTDSDKAREEALIERLVEVVQLRNEVVDCLEMDRLREAEEDQSIKQRLESHIAKRGDVSNNSKTLTKLSKKEKKKQKEAKKLFKSKKLDADKDADESELIVDKPKSKKKKKLLIF